LILFFLNSAAPLRRTGEEIIQRAASFFATPDISPNGTVQVTDQVIEMTECGTGFMIIKRRVFEKMFEAYPELKHRDRSELDGTGKRYSDNYYYLFEAGPDPDTGRYLSEDYMFTRRWRALGGKVKADLNATLIHHGNHPFKGQPYMAYVDEQNKKLRLPYMKDKEL
jgi:hypothetical protein